MRKQKPLYDTARNIQGGVLESRMVAYAETLGRPLTDDDVINEAKYLLDTFEYAGYDKDYTNQVKRACKYLLKKRE